MRNLQFHQVLYYEEVNGFTSPKVIKLKCEFFGLAGNYALRLKASDVNPSAPTTSAYIKVMVDPLKLLKRNYRKTRMTSNIKEVIIEQ